jgi:hypothetical protein
MNNSPLRTTTPVIDIYVKLAQYPILADAIRLRMREELFRRGIITQAAFEREVYEHARQSQRREGLEMPYAQEEASVWELRKERVRQLHTDAYFADNLGSALLDQLIDEILRNQSGPERFVELNFNPELAPWELLFRQGEMYERLPPVERAHLEHHLEEIKVVLIKRMISDQLPYIGVAKKIFSIGDLRHIYNGRIGGGKIGGKAAGVVLAWKILQHTAPDIGPALHDQVEIPDSYFIGSELIYEFSLLNGLDHYLNQKYRPADEIRSQYPKIVKAYLQGKFPQPIVDRLRDVLARLRGSPLAVRSSSLLEDNFELSLAGKYSSYFCANQGSDEENLSELMDAIKMVYASTLTPEALLYRRENNLLDYDERMAVLVQRVQGERYGRYFLPTVSGIAFSQTPVRWHPKIKHADGFLRMVWGLGTRAANRVGGDYPRLVALSHPQLRPETSTAAIRAYSQKLVDVFNLDENTLKTLPVADVLGPDFPHLDVIASVDRGDHLQPISAQTAVDPDDTFVLTFDALTRDARFVKLMRTALMQLQHAYQRPVDIEFALDLNTNPAAPDLQLTILQCRPLSQRMEGDLLVTLPRNIPSADLLFNSHWLVPDGRVKNVRTVVFLDPQTYRQQPDAATRNRLGEAIGRLNTLLAETPFIFMGPAHWGDVSHPHGIPVLYRQINKARALVILARDQNNVTDLSAITPFFRDLLEANTALLVITGGPQDTFQHEFFTSAPNRLAELAPQDADLAAYLRVIDVPAAADGRTLTICMSGAQNTAVGYLQTN